VFAFLFSKSLIYKFESSIEKEALRIKSNFLHILTKL